MENELKALFQAADLDFRMFLNWLLGYTCSRDDKTLGKKVSEALAALNRRKAEFDKLERGGKNG